MNHIYASIEATCAAVLFLIILFGSPGRKNPLSKSFLGLAHLAMTALLCDMIIWITPSQSTYRNLVIAATFFEYLSVYLLPYAYCAYIKNLLDTQRTAVNMISKCALAIFFIAAASLIGNLFFGYFYIIGQDCSYIGMDYYWIAELFSIFPVVGITVAIILERHISWPDKLVFLSYAILNCVGVILVFLFPDDVAYDAIIIFITLMIIYIRQYSQLEKRLAQQDAKLKQSTIDLMVSQIKPHFLYNTLNSLSYMCADKLPEVEEAIIYLSHYLREHLDLPQNSKVVPLRDEINHVEDYFHLEKIRFGGRVNLELDISHWDFNVPVLSVLTLVENAVTHGICAKEEGGTVTIRSVQNESEHILYIIDDGVGFDPSQKPSQEKTHIGLANTEFRLNAFCNGSLTVHSTIGEGTAIEMRIPNNGGSL